MCLGVAVLNRWSSGLPADNVTQASRRRSGGWNPPGEGTVMTQTVATDTAVREQPQTARGRRTRAALLASARRVFERDGFLEARVTDIAEDAGVAHGTFYTYFDSKEEVFRALIVDLMEQVLNVARARRDGPPVSPYQAIREANHAYVVMYRENARLMLIWSQVAGSNPVIAELLQQQKAAFTDRAERGLRRLQEQGLANRDVDTKYVAKALGGMVSEFCSQWSAHGLDFELERAVDALTDIWARAIGVEVPVPPGSRARRAAARGVRRGPQVPER
jgi:AcrR family transcriptional regulator